MRSRASQTSASSSKAWRRGKKPESSFYIVPSKVVATHIRNNHQQWLETPGKKGQAHKENPVRKFREKEKQYLGRWERFGL